MNPLWLQTPNYNVLNELKCETSHTVKVMAFRVNSVFTRHPK